MNTYPNFSMPDEGGAFRRLFAERFNAALDRHPSIPKKYGRVQTVATLFGISRTTATKWLEGDAVPELSRLPLLSRLLNVDVNTLIGGVSAPSGLVKINIHNHGAPDDVGVFYAHSMTLSRLGLTPDAKLIYWRLTP